jgi:outer membrane protein assembly factor BamB
LVLAAPYDSDRVFALDAATGLLRWATPAGVVAGAQFLLGVGQGNLIVGGSRLVWIDVDSGEIKARFPASIASEMRGYGRGVLAGDHVYWPTRDRIYVFDQRGPQQTQQPIELTPLGLTGGNLVIARDVLLIAAADRLSAFDAFGPRSTPADSPP